MTTTISVAVLGDCATSGSAMKSKSTNGNSDETYVFIGLSFGLVCGRRAETELDVSAPSGQKEIDDGRDWIGFAKECRARGETAPRHRDGSPKEIRPRRDRHERRGNDDGRIVDGGIGNRRR